MTKGAVNSQRILRLGFRSQNEAKNQTETPLTCQSDGYGTLVKNSKPEKEFQL